MRIKGLKYASDLVLVMFCVNDFRLDANGNTYTALKKAKLDGTPTRPRNSGDYSKDNLHMNPAGHRAMAEFLVPIVQTALVAEQASPIQ